MEGRYNLFTGVDEASRDSGVGLDEDLAVELLSPEPKASRGRLQFSDLSFSPAPNSDHTDSPFSRRPLRNLNFDLDSPRSTGVVSPCSKSSVIEDADVPTNFSSLFKGTIGTSKSTDTPKSRYLATRLDAMQLRNKSGIKRTTPSPDKNGERVTPSTKRARGNILFRRCQSLEVKSSPFVVNKTDADNENIMKTLDRVSEDSDLISDGSKSCCLPTIPGKHQDLKSITPETLAKVLNHEYDDVVENFVIVDCRYPYEYEGGHIKGAKNYYTRESIMENLVTKPLTGSDSAKRNILIFHCEFSSERGPKLSRFLRAMDRDANKERYPDLFYPEIYLLHGGYKNFFQTQKEFCYPQTYMPMHHDDYKEDLRKFRVKSKSWGGEKSAAVGKSKFRRGLMF